MSQQNMYRTQQRSIITQPMDGYWQTFTSIMSFKSDVARVPYAREQKVYCANTTKISTVIN